MPHDSRSAIVRVGLALIASLGITATTAHAKTLREAFDEVDKNGTHPWYKDNFASLAWGQSYVMQAFVDVYKGTKDKKYLDRLAKIIDDTIAMSDKARGIKDYKGQSNMCWQSTGFSTQAVCWAAHTGMLAVSMAEMAAFLKKDPSLADHITYDQKKLGDKVPGYLQAAKDAAAVHDFEWKQDVDTGWFIFDPNATSYQHHGKEVPPNMYGAMGMLYTALSDATGEPKFKDRATRLAKRLRKHITTSATTGAFLWNYWTPVGSFVSPGEDLPHAGLTVTSAMRYERSGIEFTKADIAKFAKTFMRHTYVDSTAIFDHIAGGAKMTDPKRLDCGFMSVLGSYDGPVYAVMREAYEGVPGDKASVRELRGLSGLILAQQPIVRAQVDDVGWKDLGDGKQQATAANPNILSFPEDLSTPHAIKFKYASKRPMTVEQFDGTDFHVVAKLAPTPATGDLVTTYVGYQPQHKSVQKGGIMFRLAGEFVAGEGVTIEILEPEAGDGKSDGATGSNDEQAGDVGGCSSATTSRALTSAVLLMFSLIVVTMRRRPR